ncbi:MAG: YigZ family protein [Eubacteriales bacterium]|nr:YigZ family protein [Eubacteriales bacterium]
MLYEYLTVEKAANAEFIEKKSRFISHVLPISKESEALEFINSIKSKFWDATHNVYAYILRENNIQRYSDDGEPSGTAGIPTLDVMRKENLTDACIVTTRYFGGTLLGAGGLVRAYTKSAKLGIDSAGIIKKIYCFEYKITLDYPLMGKVQNAAMELGVISGDIQYTDNVVLTFLVPHTVCGFKEKIIDITHGSSIITKKSEGRFIDVK